jgi:hypothetical protein
VKTQEIRETQTRKATGEDIANGRAAQKTDVIKIEQLIAPKPVFFERVLAANPEDKDSRLHGEGRFHFELWLVSRCGVPVVRMKPAQLLAINFAFDVALPFVLLFGISLLTRDRDPERTRRFYIKMRTPVSGDPAGDAAQIGHNLANPQATEPMKLFPGSSWELYRWKRGDIIAFLGCCAFALFILGAFYFLLNLGR